MSYAHRLVAMSRGAVPLVAPRTGDGQSTLHEEQVETEAPAVSSSPATATAPRSPTPPSASAAADEEAAPVRERIEHTITERIREIVTLARPASPSPSVPRVAEPVTEVERIVLPAAPAPWLAEDPAAADPLMASADTLALRELMRSVRQWTASPPTIVETAAPPTPAPAAAQVASFPAPAEPIQVSIGNVVISVEDAPAASARGRYPSPPRTLGDRLARHHIRGN